jgi:Mg2+/Co2+ transporter CorC
VHFYQELLDLASRNELIRRESRSKLEEYIQQTDEKIRNVLFDNPQHFLHVRFREALKEIKDSKEIPPKPNHKRLETN